MKTAIVLIPVLGICFGFCELLWWLVKTKMREPTYVQSLMKMIILLNIIILILSGSWGNLIFIIIMTLYYFVLIPYRISKQAKQE